MDEILVVSSTSDQVDKGKRYTYIQTLSCVWERCHFIQKQTEDGKVKWQIFNRPLLIKNYWVLMANQLSSGGFFSGRTSLQILQEIQSDLRSWNNEPDFF